MKIQHLFLSITAKIPHIKNLNYPSCINCAHFTQNVQTHTDFAKCKKFGRMDLVSGEITYEYASVTRKYDDHCGEKGFFYEEAPKK
jgi:hypothetical protein